MVGKSEVKRPLGKPRLRWGDNIKIGLRVPLILGYFLTSREPDSF
jgi:hypothetical protein